VTEVLCLRNDADDADNNNIYHTMNMLILRRYSIQEVYVYEHLHFYCKISGPNFEVFTCVSYAEART